MKVKKFEKFQNKIGLKCCKWSSLNAPGTETPLSHPPPLLPHLSQLLLRWDPLFDLLLFAQRRRHDVEVVVEGGAYPALRHVHRGLALVRDLAEPVTTSLFLISLESKIEGIRQLTDKGNIIIAD